METLSPLTAWNSTLHEIPKLLTALSLLLGVNVIEESIFIFHTYRLSSLFYLVEPLGCEAEELEEWSFVGQSTPPCAQNPSGLERP